MKKILIIAALLASVNIMASDAKTADSANGAQVWADTCMRCHNVRQPEDLSKRAWKFSMQHMRVRAGLTGQETRDILKFIQDSKTTQDAQ